MASKISYKIVVDVTNGDAFDEMRLPKEDGKKRKSNTGTYFLCNLKDFHNYEHFFESCKGYYFDILKIEEYSILFQKFYFKDRHLYLDNMNNFLEYCSILINSDSNTISNINFRTNDVRYFLRFENNKDTLVRAFRHILYAGISSIVLEFRNNKCYVYPEIKREEKIYFD